MSADIAKELRDQGVRLGHTEVKEVPLTNIGARIYNDAALTIANSTVTVLTFNQERFDTDDLHDTAVNSSRLTCTRAGKYLITASIYWAANATGYRELSIRLNGTTLLAVDEKPLNGAGSGGSGGQTVTTVYDLVAGDYVEARVFQNSGGNLNVNANANYSPEFMMYRLL